MRIFADGGDRETKPMQVPLLDLKAQYASIREEVREALDRVVESQYFILGPEVDALEREVAAYCRSPFGIGVSSGTDALLAALMAVGVQPGDEVITPTYTFFATAGSVARLGAKPVFADIDPLTFNLCPKSAESAVTSRTKAVIPVHLFGLMADMDAIMDVARRHGLPVIEDAAQAIGSESRGLRAGSLGDMGCFSFFPSKNLGGFGDGGLITCQDEELAERLRCLRNHGFSPKYHNKLLGGNFRLDALQAAILRVKLKRLDDWTRGRQANAVRYRELFAEAGLAIAAEDVECLRGGCRDRAGCILANRPRGVVLPVEVAGNRHIFNQFVIRCPSRDGLMAHLKSKGIGCEIYYPVPMHLQECFQALGHRCGEFPASECAARTSLALPIYPELTEEMQRAVVHAVAEFQRSG